MHLMQKGGRDLRVNNEVNSLKQCEDWGPCKSTKLGIQKLPVRKTGFGDGNGIVHSGMDDCFDKTSIQRGSCRPTHQKTRESNAIITAGVTPAVQQATSRQQPERSKRTKMWCFLCPAARS